MKTLLTLFQTGGWIMYPLLFTSIAALGIFLERMFTYRRAATDMALLKSGLERRGGEEVCRQAGGVTGALLAEFFRTRPTITSEAGWFELHAQRIAGELRSRLNLLSAIVTLAPLMGLLGTVTGMIQAFDVLSVADGKPFAITGGVAEALIATAFGLLIAIVAMLFYVLLDARATRLISELETGTGLVLMHEPGDR